MSSDVEKQRKVAYVLNLLTVSISQIIDYNDLNVLEQEYNNIINNFNIQNIPKDETLLDIIRLMMDEIMNLRMDEGDRLIADKEYQHRLKNAVWNAVPNVGAIFATSDPVAMGVTLATQIGIGYMNYRRTKAEITLSAEKEKWKIQKNRMQHLHGLQQQLFETAWRLSEKYDYPEKYRLTQEQITDYNHALMEVNPVRRFNLLCDMSDVFSAYPYFWYQLGSTANYIYRNSVILGIDKESENKYLQKAIYCFEEFEKINKHSILRKDIITSSWALEFCELQSAISSSESRRIELIQQAKNYSGDALDVLELCAFSYLQLKDYDNAIDLFRHLVNKQYNLEVNIQILCALYIHHIFYGSQSQSDDAKFGYGQLKQVVDEKYHHYIINLPPPGTDLTSLEIEWNKNDDISALIKKKEAEKEKTESAKEKVRSFYFKPCCVVYAPEVESVAIEFIELMNIALQKYGFALNPIKISADEYKKDHSSYDSNYRIIFLGDSKIAKPYCKTVGENEWNYNKFGIRIKLFSDGKAVIIASSRGRDATDFIDYMARKKRLKWNLPPITKMSSKEMKIAQYKLAIHEYLQLNGVLIISN